MSRYDDSPRRRAPNATSGKAICSLVLGILCFCLPCVAAIPALALGFFGLKDINESRGRLAGKGLAIAGMITSVVGSLCTGTIGAGLLFSGGLTALLRVGETSQRLHSSNDLKQIALACSYYEEANGVFPSSAMRQKPSDPPHSWRVAILPYMEQANLYNLYKFNERWDSANNRQLLDMMPKVYGLPIAGSKAPANETYFQMFVGEGTVGKPEGRGVSLSQISMANGSTNTLLVAEAANSVPWTKPEDLPYTPDGSLPKLGGHFRGIFLAVHCDGSVQSLSQDTDEKTLRGKITYK